MRNKEQVEAELAGAVEWYLLDTLSEAKAEDGLKRVYAFIVTLDPVEFQAHASDTFIKTLVQRVKDSSDEFGNPEEVLDDSGIRDAVCHGVDSYMERFALAAILKHLEVQGEVSPVRYHAPDCNCEDKDEDNEQY